MITPHFDESNERNPKSKQDIREFYRMIRLEARSILVNRIVNIYLRPVEWTPAFPARGTAKVRMICRRIVQSGSCNPSETRRTNSSNWPITNRDSDSWLSTSAFCFRSAFSRIEGQAMRCHPRVEGTGNAVVSVSSYVAGPERRRSAPTPSAAGRTLRLPMDHNHFAKKGYVSGSDPWCSA
jgi:hypothetical protein